MAKSKKHNSNKKMIEEKIKSEKMIKSDKKGKIKKDTSKKSTITKNDSEIVKLIKIVLIVTIIMIVFYGITMLVTKNRNLDVYENNGSSEKAVIQYDNIMIGTLLNKGEKEYYVLIKEDEDQRIAEYDNLIELASAKESTPRFYKANLTDAFNKDYLAKEENITNNLEEFKVSGTTLVKIKDGIISSSYSTYDDIKKELENLG